MTRVTRIRYVKLLRLISKLLPLKHRLKPLVNHYSKLDGLLSVPWGDYQLVFPSSWGQSFSALTNFVFEGRDIQPEFILLKEIIPTINDGILVDVGAHIGCYVLEFRHYSKLPVVAYEPANSVFQLLENNILVNNLKEVILKNCAVGSVRSDVLMNVDINSSVASPRKSQDSGLTSELGGENTLTNVSSQNVEMQVSVPLVTLDEDLKDVEKIALIKIDCEGFEYHVLAGAKQIIEKHKPILFIELHPLFIGRYGYTLEDVCNLIKPFYKIEFWDFNLSRNYSKVTRFLNRYSINKGSKLSSEKQMLNVASSEPAPDQLYALCLPKTKA